MKKTGHHFCGPKEVQQGHHSAWSTHGSHTLFHTVLYVSASVFCFVCLRAYVLRGQFNVCVTDYIRAAVSFFYETSGTKGP